MLTSNMPNRVFERRTKVLDRLKHRLTGFHMTQEDQIRIEQEISTLKNKLNIAGNPRNLRSKKDMSKKAKIRQF